MASSLCLPPAARQSFLEKGYAILPSVVSALFLERLRPALFAATLSRAPHLTHLCDVESVLHSSGALSDPVYARLLTRLRRRQELLRLYRASRRRRRSMAAAAARILRGRPAHALSGAEMWALSEALAAAAATLSGRGCTRTVRDDPQMLRAINAHRCNIWMTHEALRGMLRERALWAPLGDLALHIGGVERPVLFADAPLYRDALGSAIGYHCAAPSIGVRTNRARRGAEGVGGASAVSLLLYTHHPAGLAMPLYALHGSHHFVRRQYIHRVAPDDLALPFLPMLSHIPEQLKRFEFDRSVVGGPADGGDTIGPGTVVVVDPHLMIGMGLNASHEPSLVYRLDLVAEDALPFLGAPSWVRAWRSLPREISFASPIVFPPFYDTTQVAEEGKSQA